MALFGIFKSKQERELDGVLEQMNKELFPCGEADVLRDIERVTRYTNGKIPQDKIRGFVQGCKMLIEISDSNDDDYFVRSNKARSGNLISDAEAYEVYVYFSGEEFLVRSMTKVYVGKGEPIPSNMKQEFMRLEQRLANGTYEDTISGGYGEFGMTVTNPIPTISVRGSRKYLANLRYGGQEVQNNRHGSTSSPVTAGNVDIYELTVSGNEVGAVYICPYHRKNCKIAPKGFTLA